VRIALHNQSFGLMFAQLPVADLRGRGRRPGLTEPISFRNLLLEGAFDANYSGLLQRVVSGRG